MQFTADQVWACAAAAQRINGEYLKEDQWMHNATPPYLARRANKELVKEWLRTGNFSELTAADYEAGVKVRDHFKSYTLLALMGNMNDFQKTVLRISAKDEFTGRDMYDFAVISCLPSVSVRDQQRTELKREIFASEQLKGEVGETIIGDFHVMSTRYSNEYNKYRIQGRMGESIVDFWFAKDLKGSVRIKGKIKAQRGDNTTQLNYVKLL